MEVDIAVVAIESRLHDAILTTMDNVIKPRVEMVVRSITNQSSGGGPSSVFQKPRSYRLFREH